MSVLNELCKLVREEILIAELKACRALVNEHTAQVLGYLRSARKRARPSDELWQLQISDSQVRDEFSATVYLRSFSPFLFLRSLCSFAAILLGCSRARVQQTTVGAESHSLPAAVRYFD